MQRSSKSQTPHIFVPSLCIKYSSVSWSASWHKAKSLSRRTPEVTELGSAQDLRESSAGRIFTPALPFLGTLARDPQGPSCRRAMHIQVSSSDLALKSIMKAGCQPPLDGSSSFQVRWALWGYKGVVNMPCRELVWKVAWSSKRILA